MINYKSRGRLVTLVMAGLFIATTIFCQKKKITHSIFILGPEFTGIVDEEGEVVWDAGRAKARDGYVLPNGNILICWNDVVKEFDREKKVVFTFKVSRNEQERESGLETDQ